MWEKKSIDESENNEIDKLEKDIEEKKKILKEKSDELNNLVQSKNDAYKALEDEIDNEIKSLYETINDTKSFEEIEEIKEKIKKLLDTKKQIYDDHLAEIENTLSEINLDLALANAQNDSDAIDFYSQKKSDIETEHAEITKKNQLAS